MPMTLSGDGTITGLSAGGLPDSSVTSDDIATSAITTAKIADANITAAKLDGAQSGSAPIYAARAWVNWNGTGAVAIRGSGNVSSITDNGTGDYTVNFATAMPDANYGVSGFATSQDTSPGHQWAFVTSRQPSEHLAGSVRVTSSITYTATVFDCQLVCVSIFR